MAKAKYRGGIARKLIVLVLAALAVSFVVTAGVSTWLDLRRQADLESTRLTQTARVIGSLASDSVRNGDRPGTFRSIRAVSQMPNISYARIDDRDGRLVSETGSGVRLLSDASLTEANGQLSLWSVMTTGSIQVSTPIISQGETIGQITLFGSTPDLRGWALSTVWTTLAGALIAVLAGLLVAVRMARGISGPIVTLADHVREVHQSENYSQSIDIKADGEVAQLVEGFDAMLVGIRDRDARIAAHVENLEGEVATRTAELVVARDAAETANAAKSDFLAVMSHEIRTPLNGILALSDMLAQSDLPQRQQRYADVISKSGKSLLSIINDILDFSKVEAGKMELESVAMNLAEAAEDVASLFSEKALSKGLDLAVFVDPRIGSVMGDPTRLRQVIANLVNNAIKFTERGGVMIAITPEDTAANAIRIAIEDTGPGIPADKLPTLFEAFTQADQSTTRQYGGTGLGLAICDRLVRSMGGEWSLSSVLGEGSCFAFSAPFEPVAETEPVDAFGLSGTLFVGDVGDQTGQALHDYANAIGLSLTGRGEANARFLAVSDDDHYGSVVVCNTEDEAQALIRRNASVCAIVKPLRRSDCLALIAQMVAGQAPVLAGEVRSSADIVTFPGTRVLVVDDSEVNREVASEALSRLGAEVATANDGQQAVERLRTHRYDLVLMDGSMPVLDGFEATRVIRNEETANTDRASATIYALTAHVVGSGADAWKSSGMDGVIHKPFTLDDLVKVLSQVCPDRLVRSARTALIEPVVAQVEPRPESLSSRSRGPDVDDLFDLDVRSELLAMSKAGRGDFVQRVHALYWTNAPLKCEESRDAQASGDADSLARAAHALKSMSLSLGAAAVARECAMLENAARTNADVSALDTARLQTLVDQTMGAMACDLTPEQTPLSALDELKLGVERGELYLVYQPLMDRNGGFGNKVEALIRWVHPQKGQLSPDDFIPRLEKEGGIAVLTDFVIARAIDDMDRHRHVRVSINASASEFQDKGFADRVIRLVRQAGFDPSRLEIEVTETAMLDVAAAAHTIGKLKAAGFDCALDDFGAGFTSLHALRELKFATLKIDASFVDKCTDDTASAAIIHAVIGVGRALGMKVVCEGVETASQASFLRVAGAHFLQGYHFHRPLMADKLEHIWKAAA